MSCAVDYWLAEKCISNPRISGGVAVMLRYLNNWLVAHKQRELELDEFADLLRDEYEVREVAGTLLVIGLGPASDWMWQKRWEG